MADYWSGFRCWRGCLSLTHLFEMDPKFRIATFGLKTRNIHDVSILWHEVFPYLGPFSVDHACNGQTDRHIRIAKASLHYVARPKMRFYRAYYSRCYHFSRCIICHATLWRHCTCPLIIITSSVYASPPWHRCPLLWLCGKWSLGLTLM